MPGAEVGPAGRGARAPLEPAIVLGEAVNGVDGRANVGAGALLERVYVRSCLQTRDLAKVDEPEGKVEGDEHDERVALAQSFQVLLRVSRICLLKSRL
jgi:hypothetical protein